MLALLVQYSNSPSDSLGQMSARPGLLGPVRLGDAEGVAQGRYAGLQVELGGLGKVGLLAEVVEVKQRGAALHLSLHQCGWSDLKNEKKKTRKSEKMSGFCPDAERTSYCHLQKTKLLKIVSDI